MKKAASRKPQSKPVVKKEEKHHWAVKENNTSYVETTYCDMTESEALKELTEWADQTVGIWTLYKLVPTHTAQMPQNKALITCLATGETSTITVE